MVVEGRPLVNPTLDHVIALVRAQAPHLLPTLRAADPGLAPWAVTVVATTVLPAVVGRRHSGRVLSRAWALVLGAVGSTVAVGTAGLLAGTGQLTGPDLTSHHALLEAVALACIGGALGFVFARRESHGR